MLQFAKKAGPNFFYDSYSLTYFVSLFSFYASWKYHKTRGEIGQYETCWNRTGNKKVGNMTSGKLKFHCENICIKAYYFSRRLCSIACMLLSCHVRVSEWNYTLHLPECQGTPCSKQARCLKFKWQQRDSNPQPLSS